MLASFYNADLTSANLTYANLTHANLSRAKLLRAYILDVNFNSVKLKNTDFTNAIFSYITFSNIDISTAKGLDTIRYRSPSSIGIDAIYQSEGRIPDAFLRGAGVPENCITYMPSLIGKTFDFYSCFISYSAKNQGFADRLYADLLAKGVRCWLASEDLKIGDKIRLGIDESIRKNDKLLLILSKHSVVSDWVEKEVESAFEMERNQKRTVLVPIRLDDTVMKIQNGWPADIR